MHPLICIGWAQGRVPLYIYQDVGLRGTCMNYDGWLHTSVIHHLWVQVPTYLDLPIWDSLTVFCHVFVTWGQASQQCVYCGCHRVDWGTLMAWPHSQTCRYEYLLVFQ